MVEEATGSSEEPAENAEEAGKNAEEQAEDAENPARDAETAAEDAEKDAEDAETAAEDAKKDAEDAEKPAEDAENAKKPAEDAEEEEALTISDNLAKSHFPELMDQAQEVFEVTDKEGEVIEEWRAVDEPEKAVSNVEALEKIESEITDEDDKADIKRLLAWAKSSKKKKTATMVIREKKKLDMFKKAVDVDDIDIIIEESSTGSDRRTNSRTASSASRYICVKVVIYKIGTEGASFVFHFY